MVPRLQQHMAHEILNENAELPEVPPPLEERQKSDL